MRAQRQAVIGPAADGYAGQSARQRRPPTCAQAHGDGHAGARVDCIDVYHGRRRQGPRRVARHAGRAARGGDHAGAVGARLDGGHVELRAVDAAGRRARGAQPPAHLRLAQQLANALQNVPGVSACPPKWSAIAAAPAGTLIMCLHAATAPWPGCERRSCRRAQDAQGPGGACSLCLLAQACAAGGRGARACMTLATLSTGNASGPPTGWPRCMYSSTTVSPAQSTTSSAQFAVCALTKHARHSCTLSDQRLHARRTLVMLNERFQATLARTPSCNTDALLRLQASKLRCRAPTTRAAHPSSDH